MRYGAVLGVGCIMSLSAAGQAPKFDPPKVKAPDEAVVTAIRTRTEEFRRALQQAYGGKQSREADDIAVHLKAAEWIVRHSEWYTNDSAKQTLAVLDAGFAKLTKKPSSAGVAALRGKSVVYAYRSKIDDSLQPYAVRYPQDFLEDPKKPLRIDLMLHGRDATLTEVKFLFAHDGKAVPKENSWVQIDLYGRGNNAYRWAGEDDVFAARADFLDRLKSFAPEAVVDRRVIKGFSMGGAGSWHIGLRHPYAFDVVQPGAGFTTTHGYVAGIPNPLPEYQEKTLRIYDAFRYAENAAVTQVVAYSGELDKQKAAADQMEKAIRGAGWDRQIVHLIGPGLEHRFPAEWVKKAEAEIALRFAPSAAQRRDRGSLVTYTLKNAESGPVSMQLLERHYDKAMLQYEIRSRTIQVKTVNVRGLKLDANTAYDRMEIDGTTLDLPRSKAPNGVFFRKDGAKWVAVTADAFHEGTFKRPGLQGPIDDAFCRKFLVVRPASFADSPSGRSAEAQLKRFVAEWHKWFRGDLRVVQANDVTEADVASSNLILFGDPRNNAMIAKVLPKLPLSWDGTSLTFGGATYDSATHLPMLIHPNPLQPKNYVVINSGHTFHEAEFKGTNALLYPRLGDFAIVKPNPTAKDPTAFEVIRAGIFGDDWNIPAAPTSK